MADHDANQSASPPEHSFWWKLWLVLKTLQARLRFVVILVVIGGLIANAYMGRIEQYAGEPITYVGERIEGDDARVQSRVVTPKGSEVPIEYRLYRSTEGRWTVYDIYVDGFSLVGSYKAQFNRLLQRGTFADLLKQLRQKAGS